MTYLETLVAGYREWHAAGASGPDPFDALAHGGGCAPLTPDLLGAWSADLECEHGNVPGTPYSVPGCTCFAKPEPHIAITIEEAKLLTTHTPDHPDAPYGYKPDGTPRKRPYPHAAVAAKRGGRRRSTPAAAISRTEARALASNEPSVLERVERDLTQEIVRLTAARDAVRRAMR